MLGWNNGSQSAWFKENIDKIAEPLKGNIPDEIYNKLLKSNTIQQVQNVLNMNIGEYIGKLNNPQPTQANSSEVNQAEGINTRGDIENNAWGMSKDEYYRNIVEPNFNEKIDKINNEIKELENKNTQNVSPKTGIAFDRQISKLRKKESDLRFYEGKDIKARDSETHNNAHKKQIVQAVKQGVVVPEKVFNDYPELRNKNNPNNERVPETKNNKIP